MQVVDVRTKSYPGKSAQWDGTHKQALEIVEWVRAESEGRAEFFDDEDAGHIRLISPRGNRSRVSPGEWVVIGEDGWAERLTADQYDELYDVLAVGDTQEKVQTFFDLAEEIAAAEDPSGQVKSVFPLDLKTEADSLSQAIRIAVGAASMCWETPEGAGVFQSEKALDIATQLEHDVIRRLKPVKTDPPSGPFADDEIHHADDGTAWVKADAARKWIELAQAGEAKFLEARERAQVHCRAAMARFGGTADVTASVILDLLKLDVPSTTDLLEAEPALVDTAYPVAKPLENVGTNDVFDPFAAPVEREPVLHDLSRRRNLRLMEADLPLFLDLPPGSVIRSASVTADPLAVYLQVVHPDFDQVAMDAEAPLWYPDRSAFFQTCFAGNQHGGECVLADGHETHESEEKGLVLRPAHIDRWGTPWGVLADVTGPPHPPRDPRDRPVG